MYIKGLCRPQVKEKTKIQVDLAVIAGISSWQATI